MIHGATDGRTHGKGHPDTTLGYFEHHSREDLMDGHHRAGKILRLIFAFEKHSKHLTVL